MANPRKQHNTPVPRRRGRQKSRDLLGGPIIEARAMTAEHRQALLQLRSAERLLKAKKAREDLIAFGELMMPDPKEPENPNLSRYSAKYFHKAIAAALLEVEAGRISRLILTMPPRHGKSQLASRFFPAYYVGRDPYRSMMFATYNEPFAEDFGRDVRGLIESDAYRLVFPHFELRQGSKASDRLQSLQGGLSVFVGRGGSITGRGADLLIIDDPIKDHVEAASPGVREDTWAWFTTTVGSRMMTDKAAIIIIMTRWHEDDLVGRLTDPLNPCYNEQEAKQWKIINIPAIAEANDVLKRKVGEALWPERFGIAFLESRRRQNPRAFSALYQQRPSPEDGDLITKSMIRPYVPSERPERLRVYAASDHAVKTKQEHDFTCLLIVGVDETGNIWLLDCWWKKAKTDIVVEAMIDLMDKWKPLIWWAANDHISGSIGPFLYKRMRERKVYCNVSQSPEKAGDKTQKAQSIIGRMSMGFVRFPNQAPWFERARDEMLKFPNGKFDDFVDALSHIGRGLGRLINAATPKEDPAKSGPKVGTYGWFKEASSAQKRTERRTKVLGGM